MEIFVIWRHRRVTYFADLPNPLTYTCINAIPLLDETKLGTKSAQSTTTILSTGVYTKK